MFVLVGTKYLLDLLLDRLDSHSDHPEQFTFLIIISN
jgi:hypothetical protein